LLEIQPTKKSVAFYNVTQFTVNLKKLYVFQLVLLKQIKHQFECKSKVTELRSTNFYRSCTENKEFTAYVQRNLFKRN